MKTESSLEPEHQARQSKRRWLHSGCLGWRKSVVKTGEPESTNSPISLPEVANRKIDERNKGKVRSRKARIIRVVR